MHPLIPQNERLILRLKPHPLFILLHHARVLLWTVVVVLILEWLAVWGDAPGLAVWSLIAGLLMGAATLLWSALERRARFYALTERRVLSASGVLRRLVIETPLDRVQNIAMAQSVRERLFGLGTLGFASSGTDTFEVVWPMVDRPGDWYHEARLEMDRARAEPRPVTPVPPTTPSADRLRVIGLAGGIGAGKSEVARLLADLGCAVLDSDAQAKAILDEPAVRDELVRWWGERILLPPQSNAPDRRVDRRAIAQIVFSSEPDRLRLEHLVHPILKQRRAATIAALSRGEPALAPPAPGRRPRAVIIDAPLLFEAGVDAECDAVIFVDAPRPMRLDRVQRARGWDEAEFSRRESAQLPVEEKRRRSSAVIVNTGDLASLEPQVGQALDRLAPQRSASA